MKAIEGIIQAINNTVESNLCVKSAELFGFTKLVLKDERTFPVEESTGKEIIPDRKKALRLYHRVEGELNFEEMPDGGFGLNEEQQLIANVKLYGIGIRKRIDKECDNINQNISLAVKEALPRSQFDVNATLQGVRVSNISIDDRSSQIIRDEFTGYDTEPKMLDLVAFSVNYTITAIVCGDLCDQTFDQGAFCPKTPWTDSDGTAQTPVDAGTAIVCTPCVASGEITATLTFPQGVDDETMSFDSDVTIQAESGLVDISAVGYVEIDPATMIETARVIGNTITKGNWLRIEVTKTATSGTATINLAHVSDVYSKTVSFQKMRWTDLCQSAISTGLGYSDQMSGSPNYGLLQTGGVGVGSFTTQAKAHKKVQSPFELRWEGHNRMGIVLSTTTYACGTTNMQTKGRIAVTISQKNMVVYENSVLVHNADPGNWDNGENVPYLIRIVDTGTQIDIYANGLMVHTVGLAHQPLDQYNVIAFMRGDLKENNHRRLFGLEANGNLI